MDSDQVSVDWGDYVAFHPGIDQPLQGLPRREARSAFKRLMVAKDQRIDELSKLLERNGVTCASDDTGLQAINDWFRSEVEGDPSTGRLRPIWYGVVNDLALFLGDVMIERSPGLKWVMFEWGARHLSYQRHVIMGFSQVANPKYNIDVDWNLATYAHCIVSREGVERDAFVTWVNAAVAKA